MKFKTDEMIKQLQAEGIKVLVRHERPILFPIKGSRSLKDGYEDTGFGTKHELEALQGSDPGICFHDKGGATTVTLVEAETGDKIAEGVAYCQPEGFDERTGRDLEGDQFNRKLGTRIALGRAIKPLLEHLDPVQS